MREQKNFKAFYMYRFFIFFILPVFLLGESGVLVSLKDGDTAILKDGSKYVVCHLGDLDALEIVINAKLQKEMKQCSFSKDEFIKAGILSYDHAKTILKQGMKYEYTIPRYFPNKSPVCYLKIPKGVRVELYPYFDQIMVANGFALPYVIHSTSEYTKMLLKVAKIAKKQKLGLWKEHPKLMQCLVEHRYSLRSLR